MSYYRLDWQREPAMSDRARLGKPPLTRVPWRAGVPLPREPKTPIRCPLDERSGATFPDVFLISIPLFSQDLVDTLHSIGVDNFVEYDAEVVDLAGRVVDKRYRAVNILGEVACVDFERSVVISPSPPPVMDLDPIVIDAQKAGGRDLFRLAEDSSCIVISERVHDAIRARPLVGLHLEPLSGDR